MRRTPWLSSTNRISACTAVTGALLVAGCARPPAGDVEQASWQSTIAFVSTRDDSAGNPLLAAEIYLINPDGTDPRRLTNNAFGEAFPAISPDGRSLVFESNRRRARGDPLNASELYLMNVDGSNQRLLARGNSASWSPDGKSIAYHASASGRGKPIKRDPGAASEDSDIFILNVERALAGEPEPRNLTNAATTIDDDPDWSPDGRRIVYTSHATTDDPINSVTAEIFVISADGSGTPGRLTTNGEEERAPDWSPDGKHIVYMCRAGGSDFEICVMNADGTGTVQLTDNSVADLTPSWSPDGSRIAFHRAGAGRLQLWVMNADGTAPNQLTRPPGMNAFANWGRIPVEPQR